MPVRSDRLLELQIEMMVKVRKDVPPKPRSLIHPSTAHAKLFIHASLLIPLPGGGDRAR